MRGESEEGGRVVNMRVGGGDGGGEESSNEPFYTPTEVKRLTVHHGVPLRGNQPLSINGKSNSKHVDLGKVKHRKVFCSISRMSNIGVESYLQANIRPPNMMGRICSKVR